MSGACGLSALYSYSSLNNPRMAGIKAALGLTYLFAGRQLVTGNPKLGYDLGSISSLALVRNVQWRLVRCCMAGTARVCQHLQAASWFTLWYSPETGHCVRHKHAAVRRG